MASVEHNLPAEVLAEDKSYHGMQRPGVSVTDGDYGYSLSRVWSDHNLRTYRLNPIQMDASEDGLLNTQHFLEATNMGIDPFWLKEQVDGYAFGRPCGPLGDASRKSFPVPFYGSITDHVFFVDGVPQDTGYNLYTTANLYPAASAVPTIATTYVLNGSEANQSNFGLVAPYSVKMTPDGLGTACDMYTPAPATNGAAVSAANDYTGIVAFYEAGAARSMRLDVKWYSSAPALLGTETGTPANSTPNEWNIFTTTGTAPSSSAYAICFLIDVNNATGDPLYIGAMGIAPASYDRWHHPSFAPNVVDFTSALALSERLTVNGYGRPLARVRLQRPAREWSMISPGHATLKKIEAGEEVEV